MWVAMRIDEICKFLVQRVVRDWNVDLRLVFELEDEFLEVCDVLFCCEYEYGRKTAVNKLVNGKISQISEKMDKSGKNQNFDEKKSKVKPSDSDLK